jgi:hypothetical protein
MEATMKLKYQTAAYVHWLKRAERTRRLAQTIKDPKARGELEEFVSKVYVAMAEYADQRHLG